MRIWKHSSLSLTFFFLLLFSACTANFADRGNHFLRQGKYHQAIKALETHLSFTKEKNEIARTLFLLGIAHLEQRDYQLALKNFYEVSEITPWSYQAQFNIGLVKVLQKNHEQALQHIDQSFVLYKKKLEKIETGDCNPEDMQIILSFKNILNDWQTLDPEQIHALRKKIENNISQRKHLPLGISEFQKTKGELPVFY